MIESVKLFRCVVADPPWPYNIRGPGSSKSHRPNSHGAAPSSSERYGSMTIEELCSLPVLDWVEDNAHLYLWVTNSFLVEAHRVAESWGFTPKTLITWVKKKEDGTPSMKTGYYYRGATEHVLFCVRGSLRLVGPARPTVFETRRLPHSVKPEEFYSLVEEQTPGPYLELFTRRKRVGWHSWGNEVQSDIELRKAA